MDDCNALFCSCLALVFHLRSPLFSLPSVHSTYQTKGKPISSSSSSIITYCRTNNGDLVFISLNFPTKVFRSLCWFRFISFAILFFIHKIGLILLFIGFLFFFAHYNIQSTLQPSRSPLPHLQGILTLKERADIR